MTFFSEVVISLKEGGARFGGDAIKILDYLAERETFYPIAIHTANPVGRANMERMIKRFWP